MHKTLAGNQRIKYFCNELRGNTVQGLKFKVQGSHASGTIVLQLLELPELLATPITLLINKTLSP
jgi:hypothetical protein